MEAFADPRFSGLGGKAFEEPKVVTEIFVVWRVIIEYKDRTLSPSFPDPVKHYATRCVDFLNRERAWKIVGPDMEACAFIGDT